MYIYYKEIGDNVNVTLPFGLGPQHTYIRLSPEWSRKGGRARAAGPPESRQRSSCRPKKRQLTHDMSILPRGLGLS